MKLNVLTTNIFFKTQASSSEALGGTSTTSSTNVSPPITRYFSDVYTFQSEGRFPFCGIFRAERHFLLFKDQLVESGRQKTKENIIPREKFRLVENDP